MADSHDLKTRIDTELRAFLSAVDEYQICTTELAALCKSGCFDIARARKAMSVQGSTVSELQYPAQFTARFHVEVDTESDYIFRASSTVPQEPEEGTPKSVDPLNWFGILVPVHLRNSQRTFSRSLESVIGAARASAKMTRHYQQYLDLLEEKKSKNIT